MSASNRPEDLDEAAKYAPKWIREGQQRPLQAGTRRLPTAPQLVVSDNTPDTRDPPSGTPGRRVDSAFEGDLPNSPSSAANRRMDSAFEGDVPNPPSEAPSRRTDNAFEGDLALRRMRMQRSLEPERLTEPQWTRRSRFPFGMILRTTAAIAIATAGALIYVGALPLPFGQALSVAAVHETTGTEQRAPEPRDPPRPAKMADRVGELRIPPAARPQPAPAAPETVARLEEPAPAVAPGQLKPWPQATPMPAPAAPAAAAAPPAAAPPAAARAPVTRQLDPEEIDTLIKRGEAFFNQGDISGARLMLQRAAEAGNARAALALGGTFDPDVLRKMGVLGFHADAAQARKWYERAVALGSGEASRRLAGLSQ